VPAEDDAPVLSDEANAVAAFALRHALESIEASGGPLIPFLVTASASGEDQHLRRFVAGALEEAVRLANHEAERAGDGDIAAVAWTGT